MTRVRAVGFPRHSCETGDSTVGWGLSTAKKAGIQKNLSKRFKLNILLKPFPRYLPQNWAFFTKKTPVGTVISGFG
jgi:hypothetical protein